ncbi:MAG TPA: hypothetical protein VMW16_08665 [Sedimentisphaerales bacterium]|nr:hypothetical protein [Sedimentisphaerales bacterium]
MNLQAKLPNADFVVKAAIAIFIVMFVIRLTPDGWGIKKWFTPV